MGVALALFQRIRSFGHSLYGRFSLGVFVSGGIIYRTCWLDRGLHPLDIVQYNYNIVILYKILRNKKG